MKEALADINPLHHAGEGFYATEEYSRPNDISDPHTRGMVGHEEEYYPPADRKNKMRRY